MRRIDEGSQDEVTRACLPGASSQQPAASNQQPATCPRPAQGESSFSEVRWYLN